MRKILIASTHAVLAASIQTLASEDEGAEGAEPRWLIGPRVSNPAARCGLVGTSTLVVGIPIKCVALRQERNDTAESNAVVLLILDKSLMSAN